MTANTVASVRRILYLDHTAVLGGGELALLALVKELDRTRFDPVVLLFSEGPLLADMQAIAETHVLPMPQELADARRESMHGAGGLPWRKAIGLLRFMASLSRVVDRLRPDLIHTNSLKSDLLGGFVARYQGVPVVWHIRDRIDEDYLPARAVRVFRVACGLLPQGLIANSRATLKSLYLRQDKPAAVISSGIDLQPFEQAAAANAETLAAAIASGRELRVGLIGRICPWKGQEIFLRAAARVLDQRPGVRFFIIGAPLFGEDAFASDLRRLAADLGITGQVEFTGFQRNMPEVIARLDLVVHASTIPEPFGQVVVQGMAAAKPVIATEGGGPSEILRDGVTGYLVPRGDPERLAAKIVDVLAQPAAAETVAHAGQRHALAHYGTETTTRLAEQFYTAVLDDHRNGLLS